MRNLIIMTSLLCAAPAMSAVTVTALPNAPFVEDHTDLFEGGTFIGGSGGYPTFSEADALGGVHASSYEPGNYVFNDFLYPYQTQSYGFMTAAPVAISGFNIYLGSDANGLREFDTIGISGSVDNINFVDLGSTTILGPTYLAAYGSTGLRVQSTFAPASYQYFRLVAHDKTGFLGGRILEIDAIAGNVVGGAVPEPASWAMLISGFGLVGTRLRRRRTPGNTAVA